MKKVTEEELNEIRALRDTILSVIVTIGELHLNGMILQTQLDENTAEIRVQEQRFKEFQDNQRVLYEQLQTKYKAGNIDFETGEITE